MNPPMPVTFCAGTTVSSEYRQQWQQAATVAGRPKAVGTSNHPTSAAADTRRQTETEGLVKAELLHGGAGGCAVGRRSVQAAQQRSALLPGGGHRRLS